MAQNKQLTLLQSLIDSVKSVGVDRTIEMLSSNSESGVLGFKTQQIIEITCKNFGVTENQIKIKKNKTGTVRECFCVICYFLYNDLKIEKNQLLKRFNVAYATVWSSIAYIKKLEAHIPQDKMLLDKIENLKIILKDYLK
jgi:hypothetical protein